jgi:hypothetical protein
MEQLSNLHERNQLSIYVLMRWWENKSKYYHIKNGHFDVELYIRVCKAKENFTPNIDSPKN